MPGESHFIISMQPSKPSSAKAQVLLLSKTKKLLQSKKSERIFEDVHSLDLTEKEVSTLIYVGKLCQRETFVLVKTDFSQEQYEEKAIFYILDSLDSDHKQVIFRALQLVNWDLVSQFCGCCGKKTRLDEKEFVKICIDNLCRHRMYPHYSISIIVLICKANELLLVRSPHFRQGMYCPVSGFVESGEKTEDAVHREIMEEVGIEVKNLRYVDSQPWPFPNTMMLGYQAEYKSGALNINKDELEDGGWFPIDKLPTLPIESSIGHQLIKRYLNQVNSNSNGKPSTLSSKDQTFFVKTDKSSDGRVRGRSYSDSDIQVSNHGLKL